MIVSLSRPRATETAIDREHVRLILDERFPPRQPRAHHPPRQAPRPFPSAEPFSADHHRLHPPGLPPPAPQFLAPDVRRAGLPHGVLPPEGQQPVYVRLPAACWLGGGDGPGAEKEAVRAVYRAKGLREPRAGELWGFEDIRGGAEALGGGVAWEGEVVLLGGVAPLPPFLCSSFHIRPSCRARYTYIPWPRASESRIMHGVGNLNRLLFHIPLDIPSGRKAPLFSRSTPMICDVANARRVSQTTRKLKAGTPQE
ncbi:hypothetical protein VUR80DRAFT_3086 [Thermomyces stellatus]